MQGISLNFKLVYIWYIKCDILPPVIGLIELPEPPPVASITFIPPVAICTPTACKKSNEYELGEECPGAGLRLEELFIESVIVGRFVSIHPALPLPVNLSTVSMSSIVEDALEHFCLEFGVVAREFSILLDVHEISVMVAGDEDAELIIRDEQLFENVATFMVLVDDCCLCCDDCMKLSTSTTVFKAKLIQAHSHRLAPSFSIDCSCNDIEY